MALSVDLLISYIWSCDSLWPMKVIETMSYINRNIKKSMVASFLCAMGMMDLKWELSFQYNNWLKMHIRSTVVKLQQLTRVGNHFLNNRHLGHLFVTQKLICRRLFLFLTLPSIWLVSVREMTCIQRNISISKYDSTKFELKTFFHLHYLEMFITVQWN